MRKKLNIRHLKTGFVLLLFSVVISMLVVLTSKYFIKSSAESAANISDVPEYIFEIYPESINERVQLDNIIFNKLEAIEFSLYTKYFNDEYLKVIPYIAVSVVIIVFFLTGALYIILKKMQNDRLIYLSKKINLSDENIELSDIDEPFIKAIKNIKSKYENTLEDYIRLSSYINHEQKNAIQLLHARLQSGSDDELLKIINNMSNTIDDILTLGAHDKSFETIDAALICANACDTYRKTYQNIIFIFDEDSVYTITGNELWLYRAVCNLIENAVKYGNKSQIKVSVLSSRGSVRISISDKGIGIENKFLDRLFNNRFRLNDLNKNGYGIGLSLVRHVCELFGGIETIKSGSEGTTVILAFPLTLD